MDIFKRRKESEAVVARHLCATVAAAGGEAYKWENPYRRGVQDWLCFLPEGKLLVVETKSRTGNLAHLQVWRRRLLRTLGHDVRVCHTKAEVDALGI